MGTLICRDRGFLLRPLSLLASAMASSAPSTVLIATVGGRTMLAPVSTPAGLATVPLAAVPADADGKDRPARSRINLRDLWVAQTWIVVAGVEDRYVPRDRVEQTLRKRYIRRKWD